MLSKRILVVASELVCRRNFAKSFHNPFFPDRVSKLKSYFSSAIFASTVAVGISAYVFYKHNTFIENDERALRDIIEVEQKDGSIVVPNNQKYDEAINKSRDILLRLKEEFGVPGIIVGVSVDGKTVWTEGLGYADVENRVLCSADTVMRIASISKSITMAAVAKLVEQGLIDLDKPIQEYVPTFPEKTFDGKPVVITTRQLLSHTSGIRHYEKNANKQTDPSNVKANENSNNSQHDTQKDKNFKSNNGKSKQEEKSEFDNKEYYIKDKHNVNSSLNLFKDDPLVAQPGTKFHYSTHAWTVVSAIIESVCKEDFQHHLSRLFQTLGMKNTYFDENDNIIYNRSRNYTRNLNRRLSNTPYVDNSYKWAGGGLLSSVSDLLQFANVMLYSYQLNNHDLSENSLNSSDQVKRKETLRPGFLSSEMVKLMWTPVIDAKTCKYALGWFVFPEKYECEFCHKVLFSVLHTGGAVGASSILLILPRSPLTNRATVSESDVPPKGVVVAIATNLTGISLSATALQIANFFNSQ